MQPRISAVPVWVRLGAIGLGSLAFARWAPAGIDAALIIAGFVMLVGAIIGLRLWVSELIPRTPLMPETERSSRPHDFVPL